MQFCKPEHGWDCPPSPGCAFTFVRKNPFFAVPVFLASGTFAVVISKVMMDMEAVGRYGDKHEFEKPWFLDWSMFVGMILCLLGFFGEVWYRKLRHLEKLEVSKKLYWVIIIPALCDMLSTFMMNVGLLWIPGSIWQMLRGSIVIFTAILQVTYRKRRLYSSGWTGVATVAIALVIVGCACIKTPPAGVTPSGSSSTSQSTNETEVWELLLGMILVVLAQLLQATQTIVEEKLLHDVKAPPTLIVGMEGVWGFLLCTCIAMPIAQALPGAEGQGLHEDSIDSFIMLGNSPALLGMAIGYVAVILMFNFYGMIITEVTNAMVRNLLEPIRTLFIWVTDIFIFYVIDPRYGESVNLWSILEGFGFVVLCFGFFIYNGVIKLPFLTYPPKEGEETKPLLSESTPGVQAKDDTASASAAPPPPSRKAPVDDGDDDHDQQHSPDS